VFLQPEAVIENQHDHTMDNCQLLKTPEEIRAHPKASARKQSLSVRKSGHKETKNGNSNR